MTLSAPIYERPVELLQHLLRFDTTNPPGNEADCIAYIDGLLQSLGIATTLLEKAPGRPNLIARLPGTGQGEPLLLYGHVDVVPTVGQDWARPPFAADLIDGYLWGRGALDMKGGVAMMLAAFLRAKAENLSLPGDLVLCILSDEEAGGDMGARFLVEEHPDLFSGIRYAIGEFGAFTLYLGGKRFYPIMVAEKQVCWLKATVRGPAGHASMPIRGGAMAKAARVLQTLDQHPLPIHITPAVQIMLDSMAEVLPPTLRPQIESLLNPATTDTVLEMMGASGRFFGPLLRHTVSPTIIRGGSKTNVIPGEVTIEMDGRLLPGFTPDDLLRELRDLLGEEVMLEITRYDRGVAEVDMGRFDVLASILKKADPEGTPIPLVFPAVTDGRYFSRIGIQTYGFLPMTLPEDFNFIQTVHAADERIPAEAVTFGTEAIYQALQQFNGGGTTNLPKSAGR